MPCDSSHLRPTEREEESVRLFGFLAEIGHVPDAEYDRCYGNVKRLDQDTRALCDWCRANDVTTKSLELQIWWRDHQRADAAKAQAAARAAEDARIKKAALKKLTPRELSALGVKP